MNKYQLIKTIKLTQKNNNLIAADNVNSVFVGQVKIIVCGNRLRVTDVADTTSTTSQNM